jgi:predicted nuclease with TOPRIM domain
MKQKMKSAKKDRYTVVLEQLNSQFKVFGENLAGFRSEVKKRLDKLEENQEVTLEYLFKIDDRLNEIERELRDIKAELEKIDESKIDKRKFQFLKKKVQEIEKELKRVVECQKSQKLIFA